MESRSKTDELFLLTMIEKVNMNNITFITKQSRSIIAALGSNGSPTMNDLCSALKDCQKFNVEIQKLKMSDFKLNPLAIASIMDIKHKVDYIKEHIVEATLSKSYAFYTPEALEGLSEENKKINDLKNKNLDNLELAYKLGKVKGINKVIDSCIKVNKALAILPFSKNGPDHPAIIADLERVIDMNTKTLQQMQFLNRETQQPQPKTKLVSNVQELEVAEEQPEA